MEVKEPSQTYLAAADRQLTEIGLLPDGWCAERLGNVSTCVIGLTYSPEDVADYGTLVLRSSNIQDGRLTFSDCVFVRMALPERVVTREGDLLVCVRNGSRSLIGKAALIDPSAAGSAFGAFMSVLRSNDGPYLRQIFETASLKRQIEQGMGATINQITNRDMDALLVPWPSSAEERRAIGSALTTADALIDSLERLLTKKRQIKQGAMQELLTGKRRLPGFTGDWADYTLSQLAVIRSGGTPSTRQSEFWDGAIPWCTPTDITTLAGAKYIIETERSISEKGLKASSAEMLPAGTVVMTSRATIGESAIAAVPLTTNQGFKNFIPHSTTCGEFLYYLLGAQKSAFLALCSGSTFLEIGKRQLADFVVRCPVELEEQRAIADVLSCIDDEIVALESRLVKARALKQAMAQALLTGRIRLVEPTP